MNYKYDPAVRRFWLLPLTVALVVLWATLAQAQSRNLANREVPTDVTAMRMNYDASKQQVVFEGGVKVVRPDFELDADRLIIYLKSKPQAQTSEATAQDDPLAGMSGGDVDRLVALGNVQMRKDGRTGTCGQATYHVARELLVMEKEPVLHDGENNIRGQIINFYVGENRSEVIGGKGAPVRATFKSSGKESGKSPLNLGQ